RPQVIPIRPESSVEAVVINPPFIAVGRFIVHAFYQAYFFFADLPTIHIVQPQIFKGQLYGPFITKDLSQLLLSLAWLYRWHFYARTSPHCINALIHRLVYFIQFNLCLSIHQQYIRIANKDHIDRADVRVRAIIFVVDPFFKIIAMVGSKLIAAYPIRGVAVRPRVIGTGANGPAGVKDSEVPAGIDIFVRIIGISGPLESILQKQVMDGLDYSTTTDRCSRVRKSIVGVAPYGILAIKNNFAGILSFIFKQPSIVGV